MRKVILASTSPRRIELLTLHGYLKDHVAPKFDDSGFKIETDDQVEMLATKKMESVKEDFPGEIIVAPIQVNQPSLLQVQANVETNVIKTDPGNGQANA